MVAIRKLTENFIATDVDGEVLIVDLDGGELFSLTGTAKAVWDAIDGERDLDGLVEAMQMRHAGDASTISQDVAELIEDFENAALVRRSQV